MLPAVLGRHATGVSYNVEQAHNTTKILCPNSTVRLSISPVLLKTKVKRIVWKVMYACSKVKRTMIAVNESRKLLWIV